LNWRARISAKRLIVAAASARPFVLAAKASGREVIAADVFCDEDTRCNAMEAVRLDYRQGGFDEDDVRHKIFPLLTQGTDFVYGSGFETQPQLLDGIARRCRVIGNRADVIRTAKDPGLFFSCLESLGLPFPETVSHPPANADGWLSKRIGGSGGTHVSRILGGESRYCQRMVPGRPVSLLFLAGGMHAAVVGYNEQWLAPTPHAPWRYGGAVSQAELPQAVKTGMFAAARQLTMELGLRGLNSLDCMVDGDQWWILELNPRLSATFALYDAASCGARLFEAHLRAGAGEEGTLADDQLGLPAEMARAHLIYYAPFNVRVPVDMQWPGWAVDRPAPGTMITADEPFCTVQAAAELAAEAVALAHRRAGQLSQYIHQWQEKVK
jgi:predicted ATP-grasp superfamily ATP-dependent carboligase